MQGHALYYGRAQLVDDFFGRLDYQLPHRVNVADFILDIASGDIAANGRWSLMLPHAGFFLQGNKCESPIDVLLKPFSLCLLLCGRLTASVTPDTFNIVSSETTKTRSGKCVNLKGVEGLRLHAYERSFNTDILSQCERLFLQGWRTEQAASRKVLREVSAQPPCGRLHWSHLHSRGACTGRERWSYQL